MTLADRIATSAEASAALCEAGDEVGYGNHLGGPGESPETCREMWNYVDPHTGRSASTCGLEVRACWREADLDDYRVRPPYRVGMAISDALAIASARHALVSVGVTHGPPPELHRGDMFGVDLDRSDGHVGIVRSEPVANADGSISFLSVEGGQGTPGHERTKLREQRWIPGVYGGWYAHALDGGPQRRVTHVVSAARLESGGAVVDADPADSCVDGSGGFAAGEVA